MLIFRHTYILVITLLSLVVSGCMPEIAPTNPYDPDTPVGQQQKAQVMLTVFGSTTDDVEPIVLSDVEVRIADGPSKTNSKFISNEAGNVEIVDLAPGAYQLFVWHPQFGPPKPGQTYWMTLTPGEVKASSVYLTQVGGPSVPGQPIQYTLTGTALKAGELSRADEAARDHSGISVRVRTEDETPTSIETTTDETGAFGLAVNPGTYKLYFNAPDHTETGPVTAVVVDGEVSTLSESIVLNINPGRINGRIALEGASADGHSDIVLSLTNTSFTAITDADGTFQIADLPAGTYTLRATKENYDAMNLPGVMVRGGQNTELEDLSLSRSKGGLTGQFTLAGAQTSQGVQVSLKDLSNRLVSAAITDVSGDFRFTSVPVGEYTVEACAQGYLPPRDVGTVAISANQDHTLESIIVNRPTLTFPQFSGEVRTNERIWQLDFEVPTDRVKAVRVTGEALVLDNEGQPLDVQGEFVPFVTEGQTSHVSLQLSDREGALLINVSFRGDDCYLSETYSLVVNLDRTGPSLFDVQISEGEFTNTRTATLRIEGFDADEMRIAGDGLESVGGVGGNVNNWLIAADEIEVGLSNGDGDKVVTVQTRDFAGNQSSIHSKTIILDTQAPTDRAISVFGVLEDPIDGSEYVSQSVVSLTFAALDPPANQMEMRISNDPSFVDSMWETFTAQRSWQLPNSDLDEVKTIYAQIRDLAGNIGTPNETISTQIELDRHGEIEILVELESGDEFAVTDTTVYLDGTNMGNPDADGLLTLDNIEVGNYVLSAGLNNHTLLQPVTVSVGARRSTPTQSILRLYYDTGTIVAQVELEGTDRCPTVNDNNGINLQLTRNNQLISTVNMAQDTCRLEAEVNIGLEEAILSYPGFEPVKTVTEVTSAQTVDLGLIRLARATGTVTGQVELQGVNRFSGIQIEIQPVSDTELSTYTTTTASDGSFSLTGIWAGNYHVWAEKEGYNRKRVGENITISANETTDTADASDVLSQQTGDFSINGGDGFTSEVQVQLSMGFSDIQAFRFRIDGAAFSDWINWDDADQDGFMDYGNNGEVELPALLGEDDNGDRIIEIETENLEGVLSGTPYFQASIRLDTIAPVGTKLLFTGAGITADDTTIYSNAEFGEVNLDLSAEDANWEPDIAGLARVRLSENSDCHLPQSVCELGVPDHECDSRIWSPIMTYELPDRQVEGLKTFYACFIDPAGNVSPPLSTQIELDRVPPTLSTLSVVDATGQPCLPGDVVECWVNARQVELRLLEAFDPTVVVADARSVWAVVDDPNFLTGTWSAYAPAPDENEGSADISLPSADGVYTIYVRTKDAAQNTSDAYAISVSLDTTPPPAPAVVDSFQYVNTHEVSVTFTNDSNDYTVEHSWDGTFTDVLPENYPSLTNVIVYDFPTNEEGARNLYLRFRDAANNLSTVTDVQADFDETPPTINNVRVNFGENLTNSGTPIISAQTNIAFEVQCVDRVCNNNSCRGADTEQLLLQINQAAVNGSVFPVYDAFYAPLVTGDISGQDGTAQLSITCSDPAGNQSTIVPQSILLDTQAPPALTNQVVINDGDDYTSSLNIALQITSSDEPGGSGISTMSIANGNIDCATTSYTSIQDNTTWTLPSTEGEVTVSICLKDRAGNATVISDSITIDRVSPQGGVVAVTNANGFSLDNDVTFTISRDSNDAQSYALERGAGVVCANATYNQLNANQVNDLLQLPEGESDVTLCLKDAAGLTNKYVTTVSVDTLDPSGFMTINQGASTTTSATVIINIVKSDDVTEMKIVNGVGIVNCAVDTDYVPLNLALNHGLTAADGTRTVSGCLRKGSGRFASMDSVDIILDTAGPIFTSISISTPSGLIIDLPSTETNLTSLPIIANGDDATSGLTHYKLSTGDACTGGSWIEWPGEELVETNISVLPGDGELREVSMMLRDAAGNTSDCRSTNITVDTVALSLTSFTVEGSATDTPGFTSQTSVSVTEISVNDPASCVHYEIAEDPGFADGEEYIGCPGAPIIFELDDTRSDGIRKIYARAIDQAGNISDVLQAQLQLDRGAPTLDSMALVRGDGSVTDGQKYSKNHDIEVTVTGATGGSEIHYCALEDGTQNCVGAASFTTVIPFTPTFSVRFTSEGLKKLCMKLVDDVGNETDRECDTITIDTTSPPAPLIPKPNLSGVNASCAYIETVRDDPSDFARFEFRTLGGPWQEMTEADQDPTTGSLFDPDDDNSTARIKFSLLQDTNNALQIRVVDQAGNESDPTEAVVDEVSSFLMPTNLRVKQVCNGGQYAILKEELNNAPTMNHTDENDTCGGWEDIVLFNDTPQIALLDLEQRATIPLSAALDYADLNSASCEYTHLNSSLIDATCSAEAGEPMLLLAAPKITITGASCFNCTGGACCTQLSSNPPTGTPGTMELLVMPDPIDTPNQQVVVLDTIATAIRSIDLVQWRSDFAAGDYRLRALVTHSVKQYNDSVFQPVGSDHFDTETHLSRIRYESSSLTVFNDGPFATISGAEGLKLRGLAMYGIMAGYLAWDGVNWVIERAAVNAGLDPPVSAVSSSTDINTDPDASPMRNDAMPATWAHRAGNPQEARINFLYLSDEGDDALSIHKAVAQRADSNFFSVLGKNAPLGAKFFEVGNHAVWWVDVNDSRVIFQDTDYGVNPTQLKYAIDISQPILPVRNGTLGLGEAYVIYHTTGVTNGVVTSYLDENDESQFECAQ
jgi:hypothetical protein